MKNPETCEIRLMSVPGLIDFTRVLWREGHNGTMGLWAIPYDMRPGQGPRDLFYQEPLPNTAGWLWLGSPGWWGHYNKAEQKEIRKFLDLVGDMVPEYPGEWSPCTDWRIYPRIMPREIGDWLCRR